MFTVALCVLSLVASCHGYRLIDEEDGVVDYTGYKTIRVDLSGSAGAAAVVREWMDEERVDVLNEGIGDEADLLVGPNEWESVTCELEKLSAPYEILSEDVVGDVESERVQLLSAVPGVFDFKNYYATKYMHAHLDTLVTRHPGKAETFSLGQSYQGRDMKAIRISNNVASSGNKPIIWVDGGIHAREWVSSATVMYIINSLLGEVEPSLQNKFNSLMNKYQFVILPMSNPDGYEYSRTSNRFWRKTRRPSGCKWGYETNGRCTYGKCYGVDPNRNWDIDFGRQGVSRNPCSDVYPGKSAFTEKNTQAMSSWLGRHASQIDLYLSFHSYSQLFLKPVGYDRNPPVDAAMHNAAGSAVVNAIYGTHGKVYKNIRSVELYPTSGSSQDWIYSKGVKNAYTIELRDTGRHGFQLPASQIIPTGEENIRGFLALLETL